MQEQLSEILFYIKGTLKYKWLIIIVAWVVCSIGWLFITTIPNSYKSEAKVNVDSRTMLRPLLKGIAVDAQNYGLLKIMAQLMFTRPNLEKILLISGIDLNAKTEAEKQELIEGLKEDVKIMGGRNDLFTIAYTAEDAKKAQDTVHAVLTVFSQQTQQRGVGNTGDAQYFIEEQIREYEARLRNAEQARENFNRINAGLLPSQSTGRSAFNVVTAQIEEAQMALAEATSKWRVLNEQMNDVLESDSEDWGLSEIEGSSQAAAPEDAEISALKTKLNNLLLRYTEYHPDVLSIKAAIRDKEKLKAERAAHAPSSNDIFSSAAIGNPYVQALKISLNQLASERASLKSRITLLKNKANKIRQSMDARLRVETEAQNLDRDYSVIKSNYMKLIERREQAALTNSMSNAQGALNFTIVEAPSRPVKPDSPNRGLLNSIALLAGLLIGLVAAFVRYFVQPTFMSTQQIRNVTGLPVLGSVAVHVDGGINSLQEPKGKRLLFWGVSSGLLCVYFIVLLNADKLHGVQIQIANIISL
jgi:polysaccharide chain length determinant protein (PEP-CTERM system associated)